MYVRSQFVLNMGVNSLVNYALDHNTSGRRKGWMVLFGIVIHVIKDYPVPFYEQQNQNNDLLLDRN